MKIVCISGSNTIQMKENSISTKVCGYLKEMFVTKGISDQDITILPLLNYQLQPCLLCGACAKTEKCPYDEDFNTVFSHIQEADYVFLVLPYYSVLPSKVTMLLEKINEIFYASWIKDNTYVPKSSKTKVGIIGHGGMVENEKVLSYYHTNLIYPVSMTLKGLGYQLLSPSKEYPSGIPFGLLKEEDLKQTSDQIFPVIYHDEHHIKERIKPFISLVK